MSSTRLSPATSSSGQRPGDPSSPTEFCLADLRAPISPGGAAPRAKPISQPMLVGALLLFDLLTFAASGLASYRAAAAGSPDMRLLVGGLICVTVAGLVGLHRRWSYTIRALGDFPRQCVNLALALAATLAVWDAAYILAGATDAHVLRLWTWRWFAWGWAAGAFGRAAFAYATRRWIRQGRLARRTVIVGGGAQALETIGRLEASGHGQLQILGIFDDRHRSRLPADTGRHKLLGAFDDLEAFCREEKVDLLIVALPPSAENRILQLLQKLWVLPVDIRISALGGKLKLRDRAYNFIGDAPFLPVFDKPMSDWSLATKSLFDRVAALILIVLLSPLLVLVALGVRLSSPGPIVFIQTRYGFNNEKFGLFKFRSMYADRGDPAASRQVTRNDPRVTRFGAFIRRTSLDELPQLFNVLRGDLSLVGPRPHVLKGKAAGMIYEQAVDGYFARHRVKPGITGWAQVNGWRGETDTVEKIEQRVAHDLHYIENWSLWLDLKILAMTPVSVLTGKNAY